MKLKNFLLEIPVADWPVLRDMYVDNWPSNYSTYFAIDNGIKLKQMDPVTYNKEIQMYSLNGDWSDGTFILLLDKSSKSVLINTAVDNLDRLKSAIELMDPSIDWCFYACVDKVKPVVQHYSKVYDFNYITPYPIIFHYLPKDKAVKLELPERDDVALRKLCLDDAETINTIWPHRFPGSIRFVRRLISTDFTVGAFCKETGELMAWVLRLPIGGMGLLQVKEQYYRRGLGKLVTIAQSKQLAENGFDVSATVLHTNGPSRALFTGLGFVENGERSYMFKEGEGTPHH